MKKINKVFFIVILLLGTLILVSCHNKKEDSYPYNIYMLGVESGLVDVGYEEWLDSIRGEDGKNVVFQVAENHIQWQHEGDTSWNNLFNLMDIVGQKGESGADGKNIYFRVSEEQIQWQHEGDTSWNNLLAISDLIGPKGEQGTSGKNIQLRVAEGFIQWQYTNDSEWNNLVELSSLIGNNGKDGQEVILGVNNVFIQWKYNVGEEWINLLEISELKGIKGEDGFTPYIGENGNWWIDDNDLGIRAKIDDKEIIFNNIINNIHINIYDQESLHKKVTINKSNLFLENDVSLNLKLVHDFTKNNSGFDYIYYDTEIDNDFSIHDIVVPFHGLFNLILEIELEMDDEIFLRNMVKPLSFTEDEYNIAWLNGTMPTLLAASDFLSSDQSIPTYVELIRPKTYNFDNLPKNMLKMPIAITPTKGNYNQNALNHEIFMNNISLDGDNLTTKWIEELYFANPNSIFNIMIVDNRVAFVNSLLKSIVPLSNLNFIFYTDGMGSTNQINAAYNTQSSFNEKYDDLFTGVINGQNNFTRNHVLASTKLSNFSLVLNSIDGLTITPELRENILLNYNVKVVSVSEAFDRVDNNNNLDKLELLLNTRWGDGELDSISHMFKGEPTKNLLILGTSLSGENHATYASFEEYISYIIDNYSDEYKIFYKGHPNFPPSNERLNMFKDNNIEIIPNSIPVETVMLLYPEIYIGGYTSTSFQSSLPGQTLFFFGTEARIRSNTTIASMIDEGEVFYNTQYLSKDLIQ